MLFALVKWVSGIEKDTYTIIDSDWVLEIDVGKFDNIEARKCVVEWRVPALAQKKFKSSKQSEMKWDLHDAMLVKTSEKKESLQKLMYSLERQEDAVDEDDSKRIRKAPKKYEQDEAPGKSTSDKKSKLSTKERLQELTKKWKVHTTKQPSVDNSLQQRIAALEKENEELKTLVVQSIPELVREMTAVLSSCRQAVPTPPSAPVSASSMTLSAAVSTPPSAVSESYAATSSPPAVNIHKPVSAAAAPECISTTAMNMAQQSTTPTAMARALLVASFDMPTLLTSNLKGGTSKRPGCDDDSVRLQKLDSQKLEEIYAACINKFPGTPRGVLGAAINGKLTELRIKARHKQHDDSAQ